MKPTANKYRYAPAEYHILTWAMILVTAVMIFAVGGGDITGIIVFPFLFIGVILRSFCDYIFIAVTVIYVTVKHILTKIGGVIRG